MCYDGFLLMHTHSAFKIESSKRKILSLSITKKKLKINKNIYKKNVDKIPSEALLFRHVLF